MLADTLQLSVLARGRASYAEPRANSTAAPGTAANQSLHPAFPPTDRPHPQRTQPSDGGTVWRSTLARRYRSRRRSKSCPDADLVPGPGSWCQGAASGSAGRWNERVYGRLQCVGSRTGLRHVRDRCPAPGPASNPGGMTIIWEDTILAGSSCSTWQLTPVPSDNNLV